MQYSQWICNRYYKKTEKHFIPKTVFRPGLRDVLLLPILCLQGNFLANFFWLKSKKTLQMQPVIKYLQLLFQGYYIRCIYSKKSTLYDEITEILKYCPFEKVIIIRSKALQVLQKETSWLINMIAWKEKVIITPNLKDTHHESKILKKTVFFSLKQKFWYSSGRKIDMYVAIREMICKLRHHL